MATYYGYADRDASSQVNWAEVGKNMTDMLQEQNRIREAKKAEIDEASRKFGETLANAPTGQNDGLNGFALSHANEASKFRLMQDRLLKSGMLDIRAYTVGRQNLLDGTNRAFEIAKNLQTVYAEKKDKYDKGELGEADVKLLSMIEGFGKLDNTRTYINPTNGTVSIAQTVKNPDGTITMTENPNGYMSIQEMQTFMQKDIGKFKLEDALEAQVKRTGGEIQSYINAPGVQRAGSITQISDPTIKANFDKYLDGIIKSETVNDFHNMSTLMDYVNVNPKTGNAWEMSFDPKDKNNPDVIYCEKDGQGWFKPVLSKDQQDLVNDYLKTKYIGMLDREVKKQSIGEVSQTTAATIGMKQQADYSKYLGQQIGLLVSGTPEQKRTASAALNALQAASGVNLGFKTDVDTQGNVSFIDANGRKDPFNLTGVTKEEAGMQMFGKYMAPFGLDEDIFRNSLMGKGSKNVTIPSGPVYTQAGTKQKTAINKDDAGTTTIETILNAGKK